MCRINVYVNFTWGFVTVLMPSGNSLGSLGFGTELLILNKYLMILTRLIGHGGPGQIHGVQGHNRGLQETRPGLRLLKKTRTSSSLTEVTVLLLCR